MSNAGHGMCAACGSHSIGERLDVVSGSDVVSLASAVLAGLFAAGGLFMLFASPLAALVLFALAVALAGLCVLTRTRKELRRWCTRCGHTWTA